MTIFGWIFLTISVLIIILTIYYCYNVKKKSRFPLTRDDYWLAAIILILWANIGVAALLCNISPDKTYGFLAGIWHGIMFVPNIFRHWMFDSDILFRAINTHLGYGITYWFFLVISILFKLVVLEISADVL